MAKIQIIDDSETLRTHLRQTLEKASHEVVESTDGIHALEVLQSTDGIQLIICDLNMPRMDGLSFCEKLRQIPEYAQLPIFVLTTEVGQNLKAKAKQLGVRGWIIKPFPPEKLVKAIELVLKG